MSGPNDSRVTPEQIALIKKRVEEQKAAEAAAAGSTTPIPGFGFTPAQQPFGFTPVDGPHDADGVQVQGDYPKAIELPPEEKKSKPKERYAGPTSKSKTGGKSKPAEEPPAEEPPPANPFAEKFETSNTDATPTQPTLPYGQVQTLASQPNATPQYDKHRSLLQALMGWNDVPYGKKWTHYLQHGLVGVSTENVNNIAKMAALEGQNAMNGSGTFGQELRAAEMRRKTFTSEWDKLLDDWRRGQYSGNELTVNAFYNEAERLMNNMAQEGMNVGALRHPSINAGGFAQGFQKSLSDTRDKLDWIGEWMGTIEDHVSTQGPQWLNSKQAQMEFDKMSEYVILNFAQSKGAIADAEKIRAQVESLPDKDREVYDRFMARYFDVSHMDQVISLAYKGDTNAKAILQHLDQLGNLSKNGDGAYTEVKDGKVIINPQTSHLMNQILLAYQTVLRDRDDLATDVNAAIDSHKNSYDAFSEYVMRNGNVDRKMVWDAAMDQWNMQKNAYTRKLPKLGLLFGWGYNGRTPNAKMGDYLGRWQAQQPVGSVIEGAQLGKGYIPNVIDDPHGGEGGRGGNTRKVPYKTGG